MWHADGGLVMEGRLRAMMRDARRLVGVSHLNICPVVAVCFDSISAEPVWFLYHSSKTSVFLKTFLDDARNHANVGRCRVVLFIQRKLEDKLRVSSTFYVHILKVDLFFSIFLTPWVA